MRQSPLSILNTNHITLPTTNHNSDQSITTFVSICYRHLTLKMTCAQDVETSVTTNSLSQDCFHPDDQIPVRNVILELKPFAIVIVIISLFSYRLNAVEDLMANRGLMTECKELLRTLPDLERLLKKYELNLGASWVSRFCQTHAWRKTKKTKKIIKQ